MTRISLCLERIGTDSFLRCVAMWGREPGLRIAGDGNILWMAQEQAEMELWVSADERLILYRLEHAVALTLRRGNRSLDVPASKPVVLRQGDVIE